ncbi:MAG: efflux RND transporter permease subunit [Chloroflexota bacterium]
MKIWNLAIRQPVFMTMILLAGVVLGAYSYTRLPVTLFPDVDFPIVVVTTVYPGAGPEEIEDQVTTVIEGELFSTTGIESIISTSAESVSTIIMQFDLDMSTDDVINEVVEKVGLVRNRLPTSIEEPVISRFNPTLTPVMRFGVADRTGELTPAELRKLVEDVIEGPLEAVDGVAAADVQGGLVREIQVNLNTQALNARRIAPQEVGNALSFANQGVPAGSLIEGGKELLMRTPGELQTLEELENVIISQRGGTPVRLRDVAEVMDGFEDRTTITRLNGEESIVVNIRKESDSNTLAISTNVNEILGEIREANPNLEIVVASDEAEIVAESTAGARDDLLWGALLASVVILFFFRDLRNTLITIAGLPVIMITSFFLMDLIGIGLNQLSLLALALVVGLVIDDAIVVRENILRWIERGFSPKEASSRGTEEVIIPVMATSATILAVFVPVAYAEGIIGRFFRDFGLTVAITILISTFEALTMAPMMSAYFARARKPSEDGEQDRPVKQDAGEERAGTGWLDRFYGGVLNWTLDHRLLTVFFAILVIIGSVVSAGFIEQSFVPNIDRGQFDVTMEMSQGTPLDVTLREAVKVEEILMAHPDVNEVFTSVGESSSPEIASFFVIVGHDVESRTVIEQLRGPLAQVPSIAFQLADGGPGGDPLLGNKDVIVELVSLGGSYSTLGAASQEFIKQLEQIPGVVDIVSTYDAGKPEIQIDVDRERASEFGLNPAQIGGTLRTLINGDIVSTFRGEGTEADIRMRLSELDRNSVNNILTTNLLAPSGQLVPIRNVADARIADSPSLVRRVDRQPIVSIGANISGRDIPTAVREVSEFAQTANLPPSVTARLGGDADIQEDSFRNLTAALGLSVIFIYMVLASQFASFIQPLLIMIAMPLAVIGAIMALSLTGRPLDLTAFIGFIMLMGLVTKNSILLVDFANRERRNGKTADEAMRAAGPVRLRPILMTALSLILAMIPVALGLGEGGEFRSSMSIAIMGGMITSTFLTLLIVPVAYSSVVGFLDRVGSRSKRRQETDVPNEFVLTGDEAAKVEAVAAETAVAEASDADEPEPQMVMAETLGEETSDNETVDDAAIDDDVLVMAEAMDDAEDSAKEDAEEAAVEPVMAEAVDDAEQLDDTVEETVIKAETQEPAPEPVVTPPPASPPRKNNKPEHDFDLIIDDDSSANRGPRRNPLKGRFRRKSAEPRDPHLPGVEGAAQPAGD